MKQSDDLVNNFIPSPTPGYEEMRMLLIQSVDLFNGFVKCPVILITRESEYARSQIVNT